MANQIVFMNKLKQYLMLSLKGYSYRHISEMTGMSRNTISKYKDMLDKHPLSYKALEKLSDKEFFKDAEHVVGCILSKASFEILMRFLNHPFSA